MSCAVSLRHQPARARDRTPPERELLDREISIGALENTPLPSQRPELPIPAPQKNANRERARKTGAEVLRSSRRIAHNGFSTSDRQRFLGANATVLFPNVSNRALCARQTSEVMQNRIRPVVLRRLEWDRDAHCTAAVQMFLGETVEALLAGPDGVRRLRTIERVRDRLQVRRRGDPRGLARRVSGVIVLFVDGVGGAEPKSSYQQNARNETVHSSAGLAPPERTATNP